MPELPEVETVVKDLQTIITGRKIMDVKITHPKMLNLSSQKLRQKIIGSTITAVKRRAKNIILQLNSDSALLIHLKMTGQLIALNKKVRLGGGHSWEQPDNLPNQHTRIIFKLDHQVTLFFNDMRLFAYVHWYSNETLNQKLAHYGPEPLTADFTWPIFKATLNRHPNWLIKKLLLDQKSVAGIGNIYANEICHRAKIKPQRLVQSLSLSEQKATYQAIKKILNLGVKYRGTTFNHFRDASGKKGNYLDHLKVYGRKGLRCLTCKTGIIEKAMIAQRGTYWCPKCQKFNQK